MVICSWLKLVFLIILFSLHSHTHTHTSVEAMEEVVEVLLQDLVLHRQLYVKFVYIIEMDVNTCHQ